MLRKKKYSYEQIAEVLDRSKSSVWNEITRNTVGGTYIPKKAGLKSYQRRRNAKYQGKKIVENKELQSFVDKALISGQSPEAISGRLQYKREKGLPYVSKESVRRYLKSPYGRRIEAKLAKRKKPGPKRRHKKILDGRTFIAKRPKYINERKRFGDAEFDFIVSCRSGTGIILVAADRKLRKAFIEPIYTVSIQAVHEAAKKIQRRYLEWKTGTTDNDLLFARHKELERELEIKIYFCDPYSSWQKGTVENTNKFIRKFFPKGSDVSKYSRTFFREIENKLNSRYMKCLNYMTPDEAVSKFRQKKIRMKAGKKTKRRRSK